MTADDIFAIQKRIFEARIAAATNMRQMMTADQWSKFRHMNMMGWERQDYTPMMERGRGMRMMH
jgi:hypothetical protein